MENKFKATQFTVDLSNSPRVLNKHTERTIKYASKFNVSIEAYDNPVKISVPNRHAKLFRAHFADDKILDEQQIFRARDYVYQTNRSFYRVDVSIEHLLRQINHYDESYGLDLDPIFQRGYVWSPLQKCEYIAYLLSGGTSGRDLYFNCPSWMSAGDEPVVIVDGKQRLSALLGFVKNEFPIYENVFFSDLTYSDRHNLSMVFNINNIKDESEVIKWYLSMNTGGSVHTDEHLKSATDRLKELEK